MSQLHKSLLPDINLVSDQVQVQASHGLQVPIDSDDIEHCHKYEERFKQLSQSISQGVPSTAQPQQQIIKPTADHVYGMMFQRMSQKMSEEIQNPVPKKVFNTSFTNVNLKKIVNVYQVQFTRFRAPGFGDYLRGCYSLCQFISMLNRACNTNVTFGMDVTNHPMAKYVVTPKVRPRILYHTLDEYKISPRKIINDENNEVYKLMLDEVISRMNKLPLNSEGIYYGFCCKYEIYEEIAESDKEVIRSHLLPTPSMVMYIDTVLDELKLKAKGFSILHIRCLDEDSFPPKELTESYFKTLDGLVNEAVDTTKKYLVLSNHNGVKDHYKGRPNFYMRNANICHLGLDDKQSENATRDTMLDFFIMSKANDMIGITPYGICGFSQEPAKLFNIPHRYIKFPDEPTKFTMAHMPPQQRMAYDLLFNRD